jgi:outer membrane protein TolC
MGVPAAAMGQTPADRLATPAPHVTRLSLADAVRRGLEHNLTAVVEAEARRIAATADIEARSFVLPHVSADVRQSRQVINTAAFGFSGVGGLPDLIGPFNVFDARLAVSAPLFDPVAFAGWRAGRATTAAAEADYRVARERVVVAVGNLYLQALADAARVASSRAQVRTAESLVRLVTDQNAAGLVARIDVLRQQVQLEAAKADVISAENELAKRKLLLGRALGLPATDDLELSDSARFVPAPEMTVDAAVQEAVAHREDLKAAHARVAAARAERHAAVAGRLPKLTLDGDIGALGLTAGGAKRTYTFAAELHVPIFEGGRARADTIEADAVLRQREAQLADLEAGVRYEVSAALFDVAAAAAGVGVAESRQRLAAEELAQAEDRVRAGVAGTIELSTAQDAVARASEQQIATVHAHTLAKVHLAQALGEGETRFLEFVGGPSDGR